MCTPSSTILNISVGAVQYLTPVLIYTNSRELVESFLNNHVIEQVVVEIDFIPRMDYHKTRFLCLYNVKEIMTH